MNSNSAYTLVVVDMQPFYTKSTATISSVTREVRLARMCGNPIIFLWVPYLSPLQPEQFKATHPEIIKALQSYNYSNWHETEKLSQDGSQNVFSTCAWKHFQRKQFRVCGVNTDLCVLDTVTGLLNANDPAVEAIEVIKDACHTTNSQTDNVRVWELFPADPRLTLVETAQFKRSNLR